MSLSENTANPPTIHYHEDTLKLILFVDNPYSSEKNIEQITEYLKTLSQDYEFDLQVLEISKHPHLVEHFKLVVTPALVKVNPPPQQILAGTNLTAKLRKYWYQWQTSLQEYKKNHADKPPSSWHTCVPSSELIRLQDELFYLKKEVEDLREQIKFKDQMLAMLAHDLRTPLTAASIALETLEIYYNSQQDGDNDKNKGTIRRLFQQAKNQFFAMNKMIGELIQITRENSGKFKINPVKTDLIILTEDAINTVQPKLAEKKQYILKDIPHDLPPVYSDPKLIRQVLINILDNAIKYSPEGTPITISMLHKTSQKVEVSIIDLGPGIPDSQKEQIFEENYRLPRDGKKEGFGIGLSFCRRIIHAHYGQIWVDDNGSQGSCFRFTLPIYR
ncbi:MAG: histidine kinase [Geminocystis sp.]|nr:histidine kinase [Geminocystis sp.]MCS7148268.1 histidine kinase [Geminocystis sp.]MCX8077683.1 histidine kinase [Geminocystis sp.]MDW8116575.1 histidine kinase [Geminocystis sp.]MDW8462246.1 histidine kinase [Geminocystis sp.]